MAEIHVQEKKRGSIWPWIIGAVALLALLWVFVDRDSGDQYAAGDVDTSLTSSAPVTPAAPVWVETQRFIIFARDPQPEFGDMNAAHEYTRNGLNYLASALDEIAGQDAASQPNVQPTIAALRQGAEALRENADAPEHAAAADRVIDQAVDAIARLQQARFPEAANALTALRAAAGDINGTTPLQEQRDAIGAFFDRAAEAVQAMGAPAPQATTDTGGTQ